MANGINRVILFYFPDSPTFLRSAQALHQRHLLKGREVYLVPVRYNQNTDTSYIDDTQLPPDAINQNTKIIVDGHGDSNYLLDYFSGDRGEKLYIDALVDIIKKHLVPDCKHALIKLLGCKAGTSQFGYISSLANKLFSALQQEQLSSQISARTENVMHTPNYNFPPNSLVPLLGYSLSFSDSLKMKTALITRMPEVNQKLFAVPKESESIIVDLVVTDCDSSTEEKQQILGLLQHEEDIYQIAYLECKGPGTKVILSGNDEHIFPKACYPYGKPNGIPDDFPKAQRNLNHAYFLRAKQESCRLQKIYSETFDKYESIYRRKFADSSLLQLENYQAVKQFFTQGSMFSPVRTLIMINVALEKGTIASNYNPKQKELVKHLQDELRKIDLSNYRKTIDNTIMREDFVTEERTAAYQQDCAFMNKYKKEVFAKHDFGLFSKPVKQEKNDRDEPIVSGNGDKESDSLTKPEENNTKQAKSERCCSVFSPTYSAVFGY